MSRTALGKSQKTHVRPETLPSVEKLYASRRFNQKARASAGLFLCKQCHAISNSKHWYCDPHELAQLQNKPDVHKTLCPGCHRVEEKLYEGQVILSSPLLVTKKINILSLIRHTESKAWLDNPSSRIANMSLKGDQLEIITTTKWLATRIGKQLHKAFKGKLQIKPSPQEKFVRVYWSAA
jgi:hypothetical protein